MRFILSNILKTVPYKRFFNKNMITPAFFRFLFFYFIAQLIIFLSLFINFSGS